MTDVNIAVELLMDAYQDDFDLALLISADGDLVGPIKAIKQMFPQKTVIVAFPPKRSSNILKSVAHGHTYIARNTIAKSQFPAKVQKPDGYVLLRPEKWC